jgi:hypothetical protein
VSSASERSCVETVEAPDSGSNTEVETMNEHETDRRGLTSVLLLVRGERRAERTVAAPA